jgi:hypothetical protein
MVPLKTAKFEKKLNRINYNLISNKPFPAITLRQMNLILKDICIKPAVKNLPHSQ